MNMTTNKVQKTCRICNTSKDIKEFCKRPSNKDGIGNECRSCWSKYNRKATVTKKKEKEFWSQFSPI